MAGSSGLYDIVHRHQVYLEGLKEYQLGEFATTMYDMETQIIALVSGTGYRNLDELSRRGLNRLLAQLAKMQNSILRAYVRRLYDFLRAYLAIDRDMLNQIIAEETGQDLIPVPLSAPKIMNEVLDTPLAANGQLASDFIAALIASVVAQTANEVRRTMVNHGTIEELIASIVGTNARAYKDGIINRLINQGSTNIRTLMQQVFTVVSDKVFSLYTDTYMWSSIIDSATTDVCRSRNGNIYEYGKGPQPPAHYNCRSVTVPVMVEEQKMYRGADDFGEWLEDQSTEFWRDALPRPLYTVLREARLDRRDLIRLERTKPINLDQYREKRSIIATGR